MQPDAFEIHAHMNGGKTMAYVNGVQEAVTGMTLEELLKEKGYSKRFIAIECNGEIMPKTSYESYKIQETDQIEIVHFVGGG